MRFLPPLKTSLFALGLLSVLALQGCTVLAIADTAGSLAVKGVGLAADAAVGTVKVTGKAVGAAADLVIPDGEEAKK
jgi:hypothetical protein